MRRTCVGVAVASAWVVGLTPVFAQIPPGFEIIQITDDADYDGPPAINNCGQIVFSKRINNSFDGEEIFLYDHGQLIQITDDNVRDAFPDINDNGTIMWSRANGQIGHFDIARWSGGEIELLTDTPDRSEFAPRVNNPGQATWYQYTGEGCEGYTIYFFDGKTTHQLTNDRFGNESPEINDGGDLTWTRYHFCVSPLTSNIILNTLGMVEELTDGSTFAQGSRINDLMQVTWRESGIRFWENGASTQLTDWGSNPAINNNGLIAFNRWYAVENVYHIWLYWEGAFHQISVVPTWNTAPDINDSMEIAWGAGLFPDKSIVLWTWSVGNADIDFDGDVDLDDAKSLIGCQTSPEDAVFPCSCHRKDLDKDGDSDLFDFAQLQNGFMLTP